MTPLSRVRPVFLVIPIVLLFYWLAMDSLIDDSPTMDEQNHLARGLSFLRTRDPRLSLEHPPFINTISAIPLLTIPEIRLPIDHPSWNQREGWYAFAEQLLWVSNQDVERMIFLARMPIVYLTLGLGLVGYRFARELWRRIAAFAALIFLLFDPNILAHGRYTTTDVGGAAFIFLSAYLLWRLWISDKWQWGRLWLAALSFGLALGSKYSNLLFVPIFAFLSILPLYGGTWHRRSSLRRFVQFLIVVALSIFVVWAVYAFEYRPYRFIGQSLSSLNQLSGPLTTFFAGIEQILLVSSGGRPSFMLGQFSDTGWWYYFPVAFAVKTPFAMIILILIATVLLFVTRLTRAKAVYLLTPAVIFFLISMQSALNIGYRHLIPVLPFLYVLASGVTVVPGIVGRAEKQRDYVVKAVLLIALASTVVIDLLLHPHYLGFFNILVGGPQNGYQVLVDSNIDWGQDLIRLRSWMAENEIDEVNLSWFGTADPAYYDIDYNPLPGLPRHFDLWWNLPVNLDDPDPGVYAISVSNLWELPLEDKTLFSWFRAREPDAKIGNSIHIYVVEDEG